MCRFLRNLFRKKKKEVKIVQQFRHTNLHSYNELEYQLMDIINEYRVANTLNHLESDDVLLKFANIRFLRMRENGIISHDYIYSDFILPMRAMGMPMAGEILAEGNYNSLSAFRSFKGSEDHNDSMLYPGWSYITVVVRPNIHGKNIYIVLFSTDKF